LNPARVCDALSAIASVNQNLSTKVRAVMATKIWLNSDWDQIKNQNLSITYTEKLTSELANLVCHSHIQPITKTRNEKNKDIQTKERRDLVTGLEP